ncbi:MAG: dihydrofolate reductase family protein, partial [Rhodospirillales bacterium]|nr:dihydrofolate reductase family protein [Rhodospirillales bacterium]
LTNLGATVIEIPASDGAHIDLGSVASELGDRGLTSVLVEGGGALAASLLRAGLVDRLAWFRAPALLGGDARPAVDGLDIEKLSDKFEFSPISSISAGVDGLDILVRKG